MIQVLSPDELYPGFDGRIDMQDSESADRNMKMVVTKKSMQAYQQALDEYEKRLSRYCKFTEKCIKPENIPQNPECDVQI